MECSREGIVERVLRGDRRAASVLMRLVDDREEGYLDLLERLFPYTGAARVIGIAGSPGCGKSTIADRLIAVLRKEGKRVGVVAVDPTSTLSGGALLGDRIRMQHHSLDEGVFIRSVATRGGQGGVSPSTLDICRIMDAMGMDLVLVETVGVGQDEVDIRMVASCCVVVLSPDAGDAIQIMKAGIMEVADIFVVNKMDREGAEAVYQELLLFLAKEGRRSGVPIVRMEATSGKGIDDLAAALHSFVEPPQRALERRRLELQRRLSEAVGQWIAQNMGHRIEESAEKIGLGEETPYGFVKKIHFTIKQWKI